MAFVVSTGFSLAITSFFLRLGAVLHAMVGLSALFYVCHCRIVC